MPAGPGRYPVIRAAGGYGLAHAAQVPGSLRPRGLAARAGHDDLGQPDRRARGPRAADRLRRGRRHAARHRAHLRRRRVRGAARPAARRRRRPRRRRPRDQGRRRRPARHARHRHLARLPAQLPRPLPAPARRRPRRPLAGPRLVRRDPDRGDAVRARHRRRQRSGGVRRDLELVRLAHRPGRDLAARRAGPGAARLDPGRVLPAQPRRRARGRPGGAGARARHPAVVAARARGADRQVPHRHPCRLPRRVRACRQLRRPLPRRARPPGSSRRSSAPPTGSGWTPLEVALAWVRDRPGVTAPIVGARTAAQLRRRWPSRSAPCPPS